MASHSKDRTLPLALQHLRLLPQRIGLEAPERLLDPVSSVAVACNLLSRSERAGEKTSLAAEEKSTSAQQNVCCDVAEGTGFQGCCEVWERRLFARGEFQRGRLFFCLEGFEHCCAGAANAEGEEGA